MSNPEDFSALQRGIMEDQLYLHDYLSDLDKWTEKMKRKEDDAKREEATVEKFKEEGNSFYKAGKITEAIGKYSEALKFACGKRNAILFSNRAACYLSVKRYEDALADCRDALNINPTLIKALYRKAEAEIRLGYLDEAKKDVHEVLSIEPRNAAALNQLKEIEMLSKDFLGKCKIGAENFNTFVIEEVPESPRKSVEHEEKNRKEIRDKNDSLQYIEPEKKKSISHDAALKIANSLEMPNSAYQFRNDIRTLRCLENDILFSYMDKIPPILYPNLLKDDLDAELFTLFMSYFKHLSSKHLSIKDYLVCLSNVSRFDIVVLFSTQADKANVKDCIEYIRSVEQDPALADKLLNSYSS